jgi:DNA repair exonuclease SbcCD ATPase subunit
MRLSIISFTLDHFKGVRHFVFTPAGANADVFGDNGTGKTTVSDGYFWLLFGKDSAGNSDFGILPEDDNGDVIDGLEASVTGTFRTDDGKEFTLRRAYHQVFTRKRGEAEKKQTGNTTDFYINDVPKPQKDYQAFVAGICEEKSFRLLTDPDMFPGKMKWDERRDLLIRSFAPDLNDQEIICAHEELKPLLQYIGYKTVEDYAEITKAQRRKINEEKAQIPGRIDEAEKAKPAELPESGDGPAMLKLQKQKIQLDGEISALQNGESASALRRQIADIQAEISRASGEYIRKMSAGNAGLEADAATLRSSISRLGAEISSLEVKTRGGEDFIAQLDAEMDDLRKQCRDAFSQEFNPANNVCPTCGQEYPSVHREQIEADFNENKARKLRELEDKGKNLKSTRDDMAQDLADQKRQLETYQRDMKDAQARLERLMKQYAEPAPFSTTEECTVLNEKLKDAQQQLQTVTTASDSRLSMLREQLGIVTTSLEEIKKRALNRDAIDRQNKRIEELKKQESELSMSLAACDDGLLLAEKYTQQKALDIEAKVNSAFRAVRWKLFEEQVNGGIKPCCEATVNGIRYSKNLNSAACLNAGLDIIDTLSRVVGISVPIWIDNAESVTKYLPIDAQVIRLQVSEADKKLRVGVQK